MTYPGIPTVQAIQVLKPKPGDLLVVTVDSYDNMRVLANCIGEALPSKDIKVLILDQSIQMQCLPEEQMNALGWYRK